MSDLVQIARDVVAQSVALGAEEASAAMSSGSHVTLTRREGRVEQATEATTRRLVVALLVDGRYSSHSTSDLRSPAVRAFLERAVAATRYLEADRDRAQAPGELCGRGVSEEQLDQLDPSFASYQADDRAAVALELEQQVEAHRDERFISATAYAADGTSRSARVMTNGFCDESEGAWFSMGAELTLADEGGKRPEAYAYFGARYRSDLPSPTEIAAEVVRRARESLGAGPTASGRYPMILLNRATGRVLGALAGPLSGGALHEGRSCLADSLGETIGAATLTLRDDPTIPRGLGSTPWDGDAMRAKPRAIIEEGVLRSFYVGQYHARKLGRPPTTGSRSNWVVPPGERSWGAIAAELPKAILVTGFLGGNSNPATGDFSFGIRGQLLEHGEPVRALSEMNISGNLTEIFHQLVEVADDPWTWSSVRSPTLVFDDVSFSGT